MSGAYKVRYGPDGVHLFDRTTGVNILMDEVEVSELEWSRSPRQVSIALTNLCNLNCSHCYAPKSSSELELSILKEWLLELDNNGCFGVGFGGGEPTLYKGFVELCEFGSKATQLAITFTTHGHTLTEKLIGKLKGHVNFIRVSMDGVGDNYESIRGKKFTDLLRSLSLLQGQIPYGINFVVNATTIDDLDSAIGICEQYGASELLLLPEVCSGLGSGIDQQSLKTLHKWAKGYQGSVRLSVSEPYKAEFQVIEPCIKESDIQSYIHINANGEIKRNSFTSESVLIEQSGVLSAIEKLAV